MMTLIVANLSEGQNKLRKTTQHHPFLAAESDASLPPVAGWKAAGSLLCCIVVQHPDLLSSLIHEQGGRVEREIERTREESERERERERERGRGGE